MKLPKSILDSSVKADNSSVAISGNNFAPINLNTGLAEAQFSDIQKSLHQLLNSSETKVRDQIDEVLNNRIDSYIKFIEENKPLTALNQFEELLLQIKVDASGKIRFRIKANIGICHYILGDENKAADYLLDAYAEQPSEPKAISNKLLALILKRKTSEAYEFGKQELQKDSTNESLAGYLIQAYRLIPEITNPLIDIPKSLRKKPSVIVGQIHYLQHRGKNGVWWKIAHAGFQNHPNDKELKHYSAQATAEEILGSPSIQKSHDITEKQYSDLSLAAEVLFEKWKFRCNGEGPLRQEDQINGTNLLNIYYFLNNQTRLKEVLFEAINKSQNDFKYLQILAQYAIQFQELELAELAIKNISEIEGSEFICFEIAQAKGNSEYLSKVSDENIQKFPVSERSAYKIVRQLSKLAISQAPPTEKEFKDLLSVAGNGIRELILICRAAESYKLIKLSEKIYKKAISNLKRNTHITSRFMLANEAYHRKDWNTVIECLYNSISMHTDSDELRFLATAYANETPVLNRAILFFQEVIKKNITIPHLGTLYGTTLYNQGALSEAIKVLSSELHKYPNDLYALVCLLNSYLRIDDQTKIKEILESIDPYQLVGHPIHQMHLAQLLKKYDHAALAYEFGYYVLSKNNDSEKVVSMYFGLIMIGGVDDLIPPSAIVKKGYCIKLQSKTGSIFEFLFDDVKVSHVPIKDLKHPLIHSSKGLALNSTFEQKRGGGLPSIIWQVVEIKHKYLHALHTLLDTFETNFPESRAIYKVDLPEEDNIEALLNTIKIQSEKKEQTLGKYIENKLPLEIMARFLGKERISVTAAEALLHANYKIYTNFGTEAEFISSIQMIEDNNFNAVVLDTYTAWHLALLNLLPILKSLFTKIVISQSTIDDFSSLLTDTDYFHENESMSIGWKDGEYQKYIMTLEEHHKKEEYIKSQKDKLLMYCDVELVTLDVVPNKLVSGVTKLAGIGFWEPAILANQSNRLLLAEDVFYRQWAIQGIGLNHSTWLDPILRYAFNHKIISLDDLSNYLVHFAQWSHTYIFLNKEILLKTLELDKTEKLHRFGSLCKYIGNEGADLRAHLTFAKLILQEIGAFSEMDTIIKNKATYLILDNLLRFVTKKAQFIIALCHNLPDEMENCIIDWREKNGIDDEEMSQAYIELFENIDLSSSGEI